MEILKWVVLFLWQLPQNLVALVMMPFLGKLELVKKENFAWYFKGSKMKGGISLGNFIFMDPVSSKHESTRRHEGGHVKQSHMLGWLYVFVIGIPSVMWAWLGDDDKCYYSFYTESWANKLGGVGLRTYGGKCYPVVL